MSRVDEILTEFPELRKVNDELVRFQRHAYLTGYRHGYCQARREDLAYLRGLRGVFGRVFARRIEKELPS